ncbi:refilin-B isoform X1 [Dermochelys coriacea]|uniref:refilin-B isoform X1 n=1 Tax=Dermochelys coriacea TaxID=27794 RepID=UPI0018E906DB|nr:refilin-B isoform X1 [Dermochelys coriacea]XP_043355292.1 refilin-B isoform X1 [Dermochelys coriacea]
MLTELSKHLFEVLHPRPVKQKRSRLAVGPKQPEPQGRSRQKPRRAHKSSRVSSACGVQRCPRPALPPLAGGAAAAGKRDPFADSPRLSAERFAHLLVTSPEARGQGVKNAVFSPNPLLSSCPARLCPLSFGEGVEFDPLPPKEIRYTSSVKYDSDKHFIDDVYMPVGLGVSSCSQTVVCIPDCTWRSYKVEVHFEPRNKPLRFTSTTIVYPKHTKTVYTTTLDYNCRKSMRRFLSSIELESAEYPGNDYLLDGC